MRYSCTTLLTMLVAKLLVGLMAIYSVATTTPTFEPTIQPVNECEVSVKKCIEKYFPEEPKLAVAVFMAESRLNPRSIGYNCRYGDRVTTCKPSDKDKAISLDWGISQVNDQNYSGDKNDLLNPEVNLKVARKIYEKQGWNAWFAYRDDKYLKYLE